MKLKKNMWLIAVAAVTVLIMLGSTGCAPTKEKVMKRVYSWFYPDFSDDIAYDGLENSILKSLSYLYKIPPDRQFVFGKDSYDTDHMIDSLQRFLDYIETQPPVNELRDFIKSNYRIYRSVGRDGRGEVLYTGYYEPLLSGSLVRSEEYPFPIYTRPRDLISIDLSLFSEKYKGERIIGRYTNQTVVPYYERSEIDAEGALDGNAEVLAWANDSIDVFFLQIQGSGKVNLDNGEVINVHYQASNGRPYRSIGKLLIDEEKITKEEMSMQKIREYLVQHPDEIEAVFNYNPSYVFFEIEPDGPLGNINVKLTPGRSIALDRRIFPPATLVFIETEKPVVDVTGQIQSWKHFTRFALNQDTGGAIRGPGRADLFWGNGLYAEIAAGHLKHTGELYFLVLKPDT
ncbi:MAG: MltA domain-containing protein [Deltaproteobacteria bacterium]|nr:MltA domain-containing protein [Deltaproteobacteria bacterium]